MPEVDGDPERGGFEVVDDLERVGEGVGDADAILRLPPVARFLAIGQLGSPQLDVLNEAMTR